MFVLIHLCSSNWNMSLFHFSRLYRSLGDYDVLRGIFSGKIGTKEITRKALLAEARSDYAEATKCYDEVKWQQDFCFINLSWLTTNKPKLNIWRRSILFKSSLCLVWLMVQSVKTWEQMNSQNRAVRAILSAVWKTVSTLLSQGRKLHVFVEKTTWAIAGKNKEGSLQPSSFLRLLKPLLCKNAGVPQMTIWNEFLYKYWPAGIFCV